MSLCQWSDCALARQSLRSSVPMAGVSIRGRGRLVVALVWCACASAVALAGAGAGVGSGGASRSAVPAKGKRSKKAPPTIAVIGRPNVGKSTIANRITQQFQRGGLVFDEPGVTRDRTYGYGFWGGHEFRVVDTGGLVFDDKEGDVWLPHIRQQALVALREAAVALFVVDGQSGRTPLDEEIASLCAAARRCTRARIRARIRARAHRPVTAARPAAVAACAGRASRSCSP